MPVSDSDGPMFTFGFDPEVKRNLETTGRSDWCSCTGRYGCIGPVGTETIGRVSMRKMMTQSPGRYNFSTGQTEPESLDEMKERLRKLYGV